MKLLILDIDETLIHTQSYDRYGVYDFSFTLVDSNKRNYNYYTNTRPFLKEFLEYAFDNFKVAIWSAGGEDYINAIVDKLGVDKSKLEFIWTRDRCTIKINQSGDYYGEKNLNKVRKIGWDLDDVLILDDVEETAKNNYGNLIKIKPFYNDKSDTELLKLMSYLEKIKDINNLRRIEKRGWSK